jgi:hypothetical protein
MPQEVSMFKDPQDAQNWEEFKSNFAAFAVADIEKCLDADIQVGTIILTLTAIDTLSGYYAGRYSEKVDFINFMQRFMPSYASCADDIFGLMRSDLVHNYAIRKDGTIGSRFVLKGMRGEPHLIPTSNPEIIFFNRVQFAEDFLAAQRRYFLQVETDELLWKNAIQCARDWYGFLTVRPEPDFRAMAL